MTELAREYGEGLYALCAEENLTGDMLSEVQAMKALLRQEPDFVRLLSNMSIGKQERVDILDHALRGQVHPYMLNFLKILCERGALFIRLGIDVLHLLPAGFQHLLHRLEQETPDDQEHDQQIGKRYDDLPYIDRNDIQ